jgi:hypothetical protein
MSPSVFVIDLAIVSVAEAIETWVTVSVKMVGPKKTVTAYEVVEILVEFTIVAGVVTGALGGVGPRTNAMQKPSHMLRSICSTKPTKTMLSSKKVYTQDQ